MWQQTHQRQNVLEEKVIMDVGWSEFYKSERKMTSAQKPPCSLAGGCALKIHCGAKKESNWMLCEAVITVCFSVQFQLKACRSFHSSPSDYCISSFPHQSAVSTFMVQKERRDNFTIHSLQTALTRAVATFLFILGFAKEDALK